MTTDPAPSPGTDVPATADLYDEHGEVLQSCDTQLRQYGGTRAFGGVVDTVECFEDNVLVRAAVQEPGGGRVLVVDGGGSLHAALLGDQLAQLAIDSGWAGVVINGAVRDVAVLADLPIGVKALGSNPRKSSKHGTGRRGVPVRFGGATFVPGDVLHADDDGVVVLPA